MRQQSRKRGRLSSFRRKSLQQIIIRVEVGVRVWPTRNIKEGILKLNLLTYWPFPILLTLCGCRLIFRADPLSGKCGRLAWMFQLMSRSHYLGIKSNRCTEPRLTRPVYIVAINQHFLRRYTHTVRVDPLLFSEGDHHLAEIHFYMSGLPSCKVGWKNDSTKFGKEFLQLFQSLMLTLRYKSTQPTEILPFPMIECERANAMTSTKVFILWITQHQELAYRNIIHHMPQRP